MTSELIAQAEALEWARGNGLTAPSGWLIDQRIAELRAQAAAQAEQPAEPQGEPVVWAQLGLLNGRLYLRMAYDRVPYPPPADVVRNLNLKPLYARPDPRVAELKKLIVDIDQAIGFMPKYLRERIEAALGGK